jgi:hypothetical protein
MDKELTPAWAQDRPRPHPSSPQWFEWKLGTIFDALRDRFFGYTYDVVSKKTLRRDKSEESLVDALLCFEKYCEEHDDRLPTESLIPYKFLKLVLERNASLFGFEEELFDPIGIKRDRSGISLPQKNTIAVQCAGQILWHLEGRQIDSIEAMEERLLRKEPLLFQLLELHRFSSDRTIENWLRPIFPRPPEERKQPNRKGALDRLVPIPGVHAEHGTNFQKLQFAATSITRILRILGWKIDQVIDSTFIELLGRPIGPYLRSYLQDWVNQAYSCNSSIFV